MARSRRRTGSLLALAIVVVWAGLQCEALAQADVIIAPSLVNLSASAISGVGTPLEGRATGFIVTGDGQVLTVNHFLTGLKDALPDTIKISARVGERGPPFPILNVAVINALPELDLLLLKLPLGSAPYTPVTLGSSRDVALSTPIRTSGFPFADELPGIWLDDGKVRSQQGPGGSLWGTDMGFNAGQSGSPVYLDDGKVIGVVKGQLGSTSNINFFTPIDFADPLLLPVRFAAMEEQLAAIQKRLETTPKECRVCMRAEGNSICSHSIQTQSCSEWISRSSNAGSTAGAPGWEAEGWTAPLQIVQSSGTGFAECKLSWKLECQ